MKSRSNCAEAILDRSMTIQSLNTLIFDFRVFELNQSKKENCTGCFHTIIKTDNSILLLHPLIRFFLRIQHQMLPTPLYVLKFCIPYMQVVTLSAIGLYYINLLQCEESNTESSFNG